MGKTSRKAKSWLKSWKSRTKYAKNNHSGLQDEKQWSLVPLSDATFYATQKLQTRTEASAWGDSLALFSINLDWWQNFFIWLPKYQFRLKGFHFSAIVVLSYETWALFLYLLTTEAWYYSTTLVPHSNSSLKWHRETNLSYLISKFFESTIIISQL